MCVRFPTPVLMAEQQRPLSHLSSPATVLKCLVLKPIQPLDKEKTPFPCEAPAKKEVKTFGTGMFCSLSRKILQNMLIVQGHLVLTNT